MRKVVIGLRADPQQLAQIAAYYEKKDRAPPALASLVTRALGDFATVLAAHGAAVPSEEEALDILAKMGYTKGAAGEQTTLELAAHVAPAKSQQDAKKDKANAVRAALEARRKESE